MVLGADWSSSERPGAPLGRQTARKGAAAGSESQRRAAAGCSLVPGE